MVNASSNQYPFPAFQLVDPPLNAAVDQAIDSGEIVLYQDLVLVPEFVVMEHMPPDFDPDTAWKIIRERDQRSVFVWTKPS